MKRKFLNGNTDINYEISMLNKMREKWIPKIIDEKLKNYELCRKCGKYSLKKDFSTTLVEEDREVTTHTDCGYGDNDMIGLVKFGVKYSICPLCKEKTELNKYPIKTLWEKNVNEYKWK